MQRKREKNILQHHISGAMHSYMGDTLDFVVTYT